MTNLNYADVNEQVTALCKAMDTDMTNVPTDIAQTVALQAGVKMLGLLVLELDGIRKELRDISCDAEKIGMEIASR